MSQPIDFDRPRLSQRRWVLNLSCAFLGFCTNLCTTPFSALPDITQVVFGADGYTFINFQTWINMAMFMVFTFPASALISQRLRMATQVGAWATACGLLLQSAVIFFSPNLTASYVSYALTAGSVIMALGQPFVQNSPTTVATRWHPDEERVVANALPIIFNIFGSIVGLSVPPAIKSAFPPTIEGYTHCVQTVFFGVTAVCTAGALFAFVAVRDAPQHPPSRMAALMIEAAESAKAERRAKKAARQAARGRAVGGPLKQFSLGGDVGADGRGSVGAGGGSEDPRAPLLGGYAAGSERGRGSVTVAVGSGGAGGAVEVCRADDPYAPHTHPSAAPQMGVLQSLKTLLTTRNGVLVLTFGAILNGIVNSLAALLVQMLTAVGISGATASIVVVSYTTLGIFGAGILAPIAGSLKVHKELMFLLTTATGICLLLLCVTLSTEAFTGHIWTVYGLYSATGLALIPILPTVMDFATLATAPVPEAQSAGLIIAGSQVCAMILLIVFGFPKVVPWHGYGGEFPLQPYLLFVGIIMCAIAPLPLFCKLPKAVVVVDAHPQGQVPPGAEAHVSRSGAVVRGQVGEQTSPRVAVV